MIMECKCNVRGDVLNERLIRGIEENRFYLISADNKFWGVI